MAHKIGARSGLPIAFSLILAALAATSEALFAADNLDEVLFQSSEYLRLGQPEEALAILESNQTAHGGNSEFINNLAIAYLGNNEPEQALNTLRNLVDSDPTYSIVAHNLLEMELNRAGASGADINPILFVQSVESFLAGVPIPEQLISQAPTNASEELLRNALRASVQSWANAWSDKDVLRYLGHYASGFVPNNGVSPRDWQAQRTARLGKTGQIAVTISNIEIDTSSNQPRVLFDQTYQSASYRDKTRKELRFIDDNGRWKILSERTVETY